MTPEDAAAGAEKFRTVFNRLRSEMEKRIVGQGKVIEGVLIAFFAEGHVLLEGVPGLGKTMLVRTLGEAAGLDFSRIQFTPDLMPSDIIGTNLIVEDSAGNRQFQFQRGPVFTHLLLADEINRATPKTQSALLEAMQERQVTVNGKQHAMASPFLVLATQNPLEMEGTYPLPEAQLDRFLLKLRIEFPSADELHQILSRTTSGETSSLERAVQSSQEIRELKQLALHVPVAREVEARAVQLVLATHPESPEATPLAKKFARYGASPRGAQALILCAKIRALLDGRHHVSREDIDASAVDCLRHRIIRNFEGEAEGATSEEIIREALTAKS